MNNSQGIYLPMCLLPPFHTSILLQLHPSTHLGGVNTDNIFKENMCFLHVVAALTDISASKRQRKSFGRICKRQRQVSSSKIIKAPSSTE